MRKLLRLVTLLIIQFLVLFIFSIQVFPQEDTDLPEELGTALGVYMIAVKVIPEQFRNIDYFHLDKVPGENTSNPKTDSDGKVKITGELKTTDGSIFKFENAYLQRVANGDYEGIYFKTVELNRLSYSFCGKFLKESIEENGGFTEVKGTLTIYESGKKIASKEFPFYEYAEL